MPRTERQRSESGYYHITARGVNRQTIFLDDKDRLKYKKLLSDTSKEFGIRIIAYCLMDNHVHLVLYDEKESVSEFMQKLSGRYAICFNKKYERSGHLFEGRFWSDPIRTNEHLLKVVRYVFQNPARAGICAADEYAWSSYHDFFDRHADRDTILFELFSDENEYRSYFLDGAADENAPYRKVRDDSSAVRIIQQIIDSENVYLIHKMDRMSRNEALRKMKQKGLSCRQIERITGVGRGTVSRA